MSTQTNDPGPDSPAPGTLQFWSDISCPYATKALRTLREARDRLGLSEDVRIDHRAFPLELADPGHPLTRTPLGAVQAAKRQGLDLAEELDWALRTADLPSGPDDVLAVARGVDGLDVDALGAALAEGEAAVDSDWASAQALGVQGSPEIRLADGTVSFNPSGEPAFDDLLRRALSPQG